MRNKILMVIAIFGIASCSSGNLVRKQASVDQPLEMVVSCKLRDVFLVDTSKKVEETFEVNLKNGINEFEAKNIQGKISITQNEDEFLYRAFEINVLELKTPLGKWENLGESKFWTFATVEGRFDQFEFPEAVFSGTRYLPEEYESLIANCSIVSIKSDAIVLTRAGVKK